MPIQPVPTPRPHAPPTPYRPVPHRRYRVTAAPDWHVERVKQALNPQLRLQGIVLTMYDRRNNLSDLVAADARSFFGPTVYETMIPRNIRISESPSHGKPVLLYDYKSPGAQAYVRLAQEVLHREGGSQRSVA